MLKGGISDIKKPVESKCRCDSVYLWRSFLCHVELWNQVTTELMRIRCLAFDVEDYGASCVGVPPLATIKACLIISVCERSR
jgi:hypothetical protein